MNLRFIQEITISSYKLIVGNFSKIAYLVAAMLILDSIGTWINVHSNPQNLPNPNYIYLLVSLSFGSLINYLLIKTLLRIANHQKADFHSLEISLSQFISYSIVSLLYILLVLGGSLLLIIPGIYFATKYFFAGILLLDKNLSLKQAWKEAPSLAEGKKLKILPVLILNVLILAVVPTILSKFTSQYISGLFATGWDLFFTVVTVELYYKFKD